MDHFASLFSRAANDNVKQRFQRGCAMRARTVKARSGIKVLPWAFLMWPLLSFPADIPKSPPSPSALTLMTRDLVSGPDKEVVMLELTYPASGASLPHRHDAQVFVYVLEGELTMQVQGGQAITLHPG